MEQQEQQNGFLDQLLKVAAAALIAELGKEAPKLIKLGVDGIAKLLHKHKDAIAEAATPIQARGPEENAQEKCLKAHAGEAGACVNGVWIAAS